MKSKWWLSVLTLLIIAAVVVGCSEDKVSNTESTKESTKPIATEQSEQQEQQEEPAYPIVEETLTLKMMGAKTANQLEWNEMAFFKEMEALTNIKFEYDTPAANVYGEKLNLTFASNNLPDVLFGANLSAENEILFGGQGQLIPLEGLIQEHAPNLAQLLEEYPDIRRSITTPDGHIYSLPFVDTPVGFGRYQKIWINEAWLNELGLSMPSTLDELKTVLKAFKENDLNKNGVADEIPLSFRMVPSDGMNVSNAQNVLLNAFGFTGIISVNEDKVSFAPAEPAFKEYLTFMNELYTEGLLDSEGFSQTVQQMNASGNDHRIGSFMAGGAFQVVGNDLDSDYNILPPLTSEWTPEPLSTRGSNIVRGTFAITSANKHPEETIRWVDYLYSAEGAILANLGVADEHFEYTDNGQGVKDLIPEGVNPAEFRGSISPNAGIFVPRIHEPVQDLRWHKLEEANPLNFHIRQETSDKLEPVGKDGFPLTYFTTEEQGQLKVMTTDLYAYVEEMTAKFIIGNVKMDQWDEYTKVLKQMGYEELTAIYQQAYDRWRIATQ